MATSKHLRWLKSDELQTEVAKRFVDFCTEDVEIRSKKEGFDAEIYEDAVRLIINKLEKNEDESQDQANDMENDAVNNNGVDNLEKQG